MLWIKGLFPLLFYLCRGLLEFHLAVVFLTGTRISSLWPGVTSTVSSLAIIRNRLETDGLEPKASDEAAWCSGKGTVPAARSLSFCLSSGINWVGNLGQDFLVPPYPYLSNEESNICSAHSPWLLHSSNGIINMKVFANYKTLCTLTLF